MWPKNTRRADDEKSMDYFSRMFEQIESCGVGAPDIDLRDLPAAAADQSIRFRAGCSRREMSNGQNR